MEDFTIVQNYTLPSLGKIYEYEINPNISIRSMTTNDEMKRLNVSERQYKSLADTIDDCLVDKPGISSYDMCVGDFQFLLYKLRVVTYGSNYGIITRCPICGYENEGTVNLEQMEVLTYSEDLQKYFEFDLPKSKYHIKIRMQTPRMLDDIAIKAKEIRKKSPEYIGDPAFLLNIESMIELINGKKPDPTKISEWVRNLPMIDTNHIINCAQKLNERIGLNNKLDITCDLCGLDYKSPFRIGQDFFRPKLQDDERGKSEDI